MRFNEADRKSFFHVIVSWHYSDSEYLLLYASIKPDYMHHHIIMFWFTTDEIDGTQSSTCASRRNITEML